MGMLLVPTLVLCSTTCADETRIDDAQIVTFTTQEYHSNMLRQLDITRLRPGPSGNESAPNHANYDESLANPFPVLPQLLIGKNGERVTSHRKMRNMCSP